MSGPLCANILARELLAEELPNRWQHVQAVGERTKLFADAHDRPTFDKLRAAGIVHDIGYADQVRETGFHPIDGARHLRRLGFDEDIVSLVAHHTCAHIEADLRGLQPALLQEFPLRPELPHDELLYCDLTTGPTGQVLTVEARLCDVKRRYGPDDLVHRFITIAEDQLLAAAGRAEAKIGRTVDRGRDISQDVRELLQTS
ncbi:MAG: HD domain-containing protein [Acidimicrobiales bacterium]